jgi:hypothetical protein
MSEYEKMADARRLKKLTEILLDVIIMQDAEINGKENKIQELNRLVLAVRHASDNPGTARFNTQEPRIADDTVTITDSVSIKEKVNENKEEEALPVLRVKVFMDVFNQSKDNQTGDVRSSRLRENLVAAGFSYEEISKHIQKALRNGQIYERKQGWYSNTWSDQK